MMRLILRFRPCAYFFKAAAYFYNVHTVKAEILFYSDIEFCFQFLYIRYIFKVYLPALFHFCHSGKGYARFGCGFRYGAVICGAVAMPVNNYHLSADTLKCSKTRVAVFKQFFDRNNGAGIAKHQSL